MIRVRYSKTSDHGKTDFLRIMDQAEQDIRSGQTLVASVPNRHLGENREMDPVRSHTARRSSSQSDAARI
jgi:hypothetical protein